MGNSFHAYDLNLDIVETSKKAINEVKNVVNLYDKLLTELPWKKLQETVTNLDQRKAEYSEAARKIVLEIKSLMATGVRRYVGSSRRIYDWTDSAEEQLQKYVKLFGDITASNIEKQKDILVEVLNDGIQKMQLAQKRLGESSSRY